MKLLMNRFSNYLNDLTESKIDALRSHFNNTEGMVSFEEALLLYYLARGVRTGCIVEVGSYRGRSTVFLGKGVSDGARVPVYAVDPHKSFIGVLGGEFGPQDRTAFYRTMLDCECSEFVSLVNLSSEIITPNWQEPVSLLWIDGDHSYEGVKRDFECWSPYLEPDAIVAFDDATDPKLGPRMLIEEIVAQREFEEVYSIGKVCIIQKCTNR